MQLGDTRDRRTFGEKLFTEDTDPEDSKAERLGKKFSREVDDINDGLKTQLDNVRNVLARPQPTGRADIPVRHGPAATPREGHGGASPDSVAQLLVVGTVIGIEFSRWMRHKVNGMTRRHDASHG